MAVATGIELLTGALCQPITGIDMLKNIEQGNYKKAAALGLSTVAGVKELIDDAKRPWWQDAPFKRLTALALIPNLVVDLESVQQDIEKHGFPQFSTVLNILADVAVFVGLRMPAISVPMAIVGIGYTMLGWKESDKQKRRDNFNEFYQYLNTKEAQDYMKCPYCLDIQISSPTVYETEGIAKFTITLDKELKEDLRLDLFTVEGTATEDKDYEGVKKYKNSITIPAGETSYEYTVKIASDGKYEDSENFLLVAEPIYSGIDVLSLPKYISALATILDFPQEECPKTPKPNIKPISLNLPPTPVYPTTGGGGGSLGPGGSWSGGGSWGSGGYYPSIPSKPSLPNVPYIECYNEPYLNSMMIVKLPSLNSTRSFVALNYMSKDNSFNLSSPLLKDSPNSLNNKTLDLNTTTSNSNKIYFDMNSDGFKEKMIEWMNEDEAVLVNDINNNGLIDNGTEILGNNYISNLTGSKSLDSYLLLKEFDKNKDGVIDIKDNSNLALWQDKNKNGITDKGELTYIGKDNSPIKSISINPLDTLLSAYDRNHDFKIDNKDIIYNYIYYKDNFDNSIDLYIYGDDSAKSFLDFDTTNHTVLTNQGIKRVNEIHFYTDELNLNNIANGDNLNNKLVGNSYANKLYGNGGDDILEGLDGNDTLDGGSGNDKLYGGAGNDTLRGGKGNDLLDGGSWDDRYIFSKGDGIDIIRDSHGNDIIEFDESIKLEDLIVKSNGKDLNISIKSNNTNLLSNQIIIKNYYGNGRIERVKFSDDKVLEVSDIISMMGTNKDDTIYLTNTSQTIYAKDGKDTIYAGSGNNTIIGGKGDDKIFGSYGSDTYIYTKGDGNDIIQDSGGKDTILVKDINSNEVEFIRSTNSLILKFDDNNSITIVNYFIDNNRIESFKFEDKAIVPNDIINSFITDGNDNIIGTDDGDTLDGKGGNDTIIGLRGNDTLIGGDGDDKLYGNDGNDILKGLAGSDYMDGGNGDDTYIYNLGDGNDKIYDGGGKDKIKFGDGISKDDLKFRKNRNNLIVTIKGESTIEILNFFTKSGVIEGFIFNNESVMPSSEIANLFSYSFGGKDTLYAQDGSTLIGEKGDDVYIYQRGDGRVIIDDSFIESNIVVEAGNDTLKLIGIDKDDIVLTKYGNDMVIFIKDENGKTTSDETIVIKNFSNPLKGIEKIEFDDKSTIEIDKNGKYPSASFSSKNSYYLVYGSEDNDIKGTSSSYIYELGAGDDKIVASSYRDTIIGGAGDDVLEGGSGNDTYIFNKGDGKDIIFDAAGDDFIKFGDGISKNDIAVRVIGDTLYVGIKESGVKFSDYSDRITIRNWVSSNNRVEKFIFRDGEVIDYNQIISMAGTDENDTISTFQNSNDTINALGGDDTINSYDGDDIIDGGAGDDIIDGGLGNDTYIFKRGMGRDIITDSSGIDTMKVVDNLNISEVAYKRVGDDLVVYIDEDGVDESNYKDGARVKGWFKSISNRVEFIEFADGRVIRPENITKFTNSNDNLTLGDEDNIIHALDGDDTIYAGGGNDILDGGKGNDTLYGEKGNDTYLFGRGDGNDIIDDYDGNDTLEFKDGITPDDIVIYYENNQKYNLIVALKEDGKSLNELSDKVILKNWYSYSYRIENLKFADGTIWNVSEIQKHINTDGNDIIYGIGNYRSSDTWNDILTGGKGDDTLYGYDGNDTYIFNKGDGKDTIIDNSGTDTLRLGEGIRENDIIIQKSGNDVKIYIKEDGKELSKLSDVITLKDWYNANNKIENIELSDGTKIDYSSLFDPTNSNDNLTLGDEDNIIHALDGDDTIYAGGGNDILDGGKGNDTLYGEKGNDTYLFGRGDGNDIIDDYDGNDTLEFKDGITPDDIVIYYENNQKYNLIVALKEDGKSLNELSDKVILKNWYSYSYRIENLKFADGTIWNVSEIQKHINTDGNDIIYGIGNYRSSDTWNDILTGGKGDDTLYGYDGNDTYIFNKGDGKDTIIDNSGTDTLRLGEGIRENDIIIQKSGNDVKIYIKEDGKELSKLSDVITLKDWYNANNKIENIELSDGTKIDYSSLFDPTNSNDNLTLGDEDNIIHALDGDDTIYAGGGNDILDGGKGNDTLYGEKGNDTYLFGRGDGNDIIDDYDGNDTLEFKDGITPDDIVIYYENNQKYNLIVALKEDGKSLNELSDKVILKNWYSYSYRIENLKFADGTIWNVSEIQKHINTDGNDIIYGIGNYRSSDTWNDILTGGKGDDTLYGYDGNDTYIFNKGDGKDTIIDNSGTDTLRLGEGIRENDIIIQKSGNDVKIYIKEDGKELSKLSDVITLKDWYNANNKIENIELSDGTKIDYSSLFDPTNSNDNLTLGDEDNIIHALDGDDTIYAGGGNDILDGGKGNDTLYGEKGNDTYLFGRGDGNDIIDDYDGNDTLEFKDGITPDDIVIYYENNQKYNLIVALKEDGKSLNELSDKVILKNWYSYSYRIENLKFADGTIWNVSEIQKHINTDGNDIIYGIGNYRSSDTWNDILTGGKGDDTLYGYDGNDTYIFNKGDGKDTIIDNSGTDTLRLGEGIRENDILLWLDGNNLVVSISDSDTVIINNYTNESSSIEEIYLSNGLYMNKSTIDRVVSDIRLYASENTLSLNRDSLLTNPNILNIISSSWQKNMNDFTPPLVLDLNSNGITSSSLANSSVYFDYDGDGVIEKTAWIESGDAFLVYDKNNDGIISDGSELFGEHFKLSSGKNAKDGYEALKEFDSDGNGIINKLDAKFSELLIWQDTNLNGITDSGELKNLSDLGITSIGLPIAENFSIAENGNIITNKSTFTQNGLIKEIKDIWFGVDLGDARSSVRDDTLYDYDFSDAKIDSTIYVDDIKMLTQSEIKELIISSGYTGISTNGITAKANANDGSLTFENKWYKSDTLDTMYESSDGELKNSSGVVRDFVDAVNSNIALKNSIDNLGSNSNTISMDMDKILQDWVLGDSFLSNSLFLPPIVLDLNGNGTTSLSLDNTDAYFNYGEDYRRYKTAWIESGDAILGVDLNKDGIINSAFEVFGNKTKLKDGSFAKDGYRALKEFDSNKDGIINKNDDDFEKLVLWFDDGDAKGEAGELKTLSEVGINSISLIPKAHETLENGNKISFESNFTKDDKTSGVLRDVWFEVSGKQSIGISHLSDKDEKKISIVENFKGARLTNHQRANPLVIAQILDEYESIKYDMMSQILAKKLYGDNANTCTLLYNALNIKLSRVISGDAAPDETALSINILASVLKKDFAYAIFKLNPNYLSNAKIKALLDKTGINFSINAKDLNSIKGIIGKNVFGDDEAEIFDFSNNKEGVNILSKGGNDILMGSNFHDKLNGGNGNDILLGNGGIDTLIGSGGNDLLIGSKYSTIYEYYLGDGDDIIYDDGGKDILKLNFLKVTDLSVGRVNDDMIISIINPLDKNSPFGSIIIKDGYKEGKIEEYFIGDKFYTIDEFLKAVPASNTYEFKKGSSFVEINDKGGIDKVIFGEGITPNDIITTKNGLNLEIAIKIDGRTYDELLDKLTINNFFTSLGESNGVGKIESFIFESGIILNSDEILLDEINNDTFIIGDEKDNELIGTNNPNIINGKSGNDILRGLNGDDTYIYEGGKDTIIDSGGNDKIVFGEGITRDNLQSKFIGDDLVIAIKESGARFEDLQNSITIKNQALDNNKIEKIMYSNGSEFDINTLKNREVIALKTISKTLQDIREINGVINASDEDSDTLTFELIEESKFGIFALNDDGSYTYKANDKFIGKDEAKVKISDGMGSEVVTTIKLNIVISAPKIDTTTIKFNEDSVLENSIKVSNPSNSKLTYELVEEAKSSVVVLNDDGNFMITPNLNYNGEDFITIKVTNEYGLSDIKTIALNINPINDAPEFKESISNYELTNTDKVTANLEAFDIDSNNLTYKVVSNPTNGFITIDKSGNFTYTSNKGYKGSDSVIVEVSDGELSTTKELKFNMNGYEYNSGNLEIPSNDLIDTTLKLPNLNVEDIKFNRSNNDLILTQNSGDITIKDYFTKGAKTIDTLIFKNNQTINIDNTKLVLPNKKSWQIKPSANLNNSGIIFSDLENSILNGSNKDDIIISTGDNSKIHAKDGNDTIILNGNKNEVYGSSKNDTLISNGKNNFLIGENGDDTYIIGKDANNTIIRDKEYVNLVDGGNDTLTLNDIDKSSVEFKLGGSFNKDLIINYSNSHSKDIKTLTIQNQTNKYSAIENINLDGTMLGTETINKIIQDLNSYSDDKGLSLNFNSEFKNNDIMQIYSN